MGLRPTEPPQTMHPPSCSTTRRIAALSRVTGASVSMVSAVPAGDVIARDEVFGGLGGLRLDGRATFGGRLGGDGRERFEEAFEDAGALGIAEGHAHAAAHGRGREAEAALSATKGISMIEVRW